VLTSRPDHQSFYDALDAAMSQQGTDWYRALHTLSAEQLKTARTQIVKRLQRDVLIRYLLQASAGQARLPANTSPWMALAEQRFWTLLLAGEGEVLLPPMDEARISEVRTGFAAQLLMSQTYLWSKEVFNAIKESTVPPHVITRELLPFPFSFHSLEVAYGMRVPGTLEDLGETDWLALSYMPDHCNVLQNLTIEGQSVPSVRYGAIPFQKSYPNDFTPTQARGMSVVLAMLAFLRSEAAAVTQQGLPRGFRRSGEVAPEDLEKTIGVVTLRRQAREAVAAYEAESSHFKHRWWVSGHFRAQWHPSTESHEVVWIAPYLKGPQDAPLLEKVYAVVR
jgi:hypothetical protein